MNIRQEPHPFLCHSCGVRIEVTDSRMVRIQNGPVRRRTYRCPQCNAKTRTVEMVIEKETLKTGTMWEHIASRLPSKALLIELARRVNGTNKP